MVFALLCWKRPAEITAPFGVRNGLVGADKEVVPRVKVGTRRRSLIYWRVW